MAAVSCQVCGPEGGAGLAKYKCPTCFLKYCSVVCFKRHKETPCSKPDQQPANNRGNRPTGGWESGRKRGREHADQPIEEDDEMIPLLTDEMKKALVESKWLREALADSTLQRLLLDIDQDPARAKKLKECKEKFQDFPRFIDQLLCEIGALKYEDGQQVFSLPS